MLDTYFMVKIYVNQISPKLSFDISFGPYMNIKEATNILVDFAPMYAEKLVVNGKYKYFASINECVLNERNEWETIYTPIKENECYKRKLAP